MTHSHIGASDPGIPVPSDGTYARRRLSGFTPEAFEEVIHGGRFRHNVLGARTLDATLERVVGGAVVLDQGHYGFSTVVEGDFNPDLLCFGLVNCPEGRARINGCLIQADDLQCYAPGADMLYSAGSGTRWHGIQVDPAALADTGIAIDRVARLFANLSLVPEEASRLRRCVQSLFDDASRGLPTATGEHSLLTTLAECLSEDHESKSACGDRREIIERATAAFRVNVQRPYHSESVCESVGVSERVLQLAFRQCLGVSPSRWNMTLRINLARRALLRASDRSVRVTEVATRFGFDHFGRFAGEYKRHFGESPSQTLRRTRS